MASAYPESPDDTEVVMNCCAETETDIPPKDKKRKASTKIPWSYKEDIVYLQQLDENFGELFSKGCNSEIKSNK